MVWKYFFYNYTPKGKYLKSLINKTKIKDMENKELKITPPEGYEIDKENSTFDCIKFKPIKNKLTYEDIVKELFYKPYYYIDMYGNIKQLDNGFSFHSSEATNCTSEKQAEKLLAINKLMNVAKYLNGDWEPNFEDNIPKYYIEVDQHLKLIRIDYTCRQIYSVVYFKNSDLAEQVIEILGEDTVRLALSTDW